MRTEGVIIRRKRLEILFQPIYLLLGLALLISGCAHAQELDKSIDPKEAAVVKAIVFDYFEGINQLNKARLEKAFDAGAQLKSIGDTGYVKLEPIADAIARWMNGKATSREGEVLQLDITNDQVATVVFDYDGIFYDYLTLLKINGEWKIVDKVFIKQSPDSQATTNLEEETAVKATVFDYFEGINQLNKARLEKAFDAGAQLKSIGDNGSVKLEPIADAIARWMNGKATSRKGELLQLDITNDQVATVVFDYDGIFYDYLTLLKIHGKWKIVDKVFIRQK